MAEEEHLKILKEGVEAWNAWVSEQARIGTLNAPDLRRASLIKGDLSGADLRHSSLSGADFSRANLAGADLGSAVLIGAKFFEADLTGANFNGAHASWSNFTSAKLVKSELSRADIGRANFDGAILIDAKFSDALLYSTVFSNVDLTSVRDLERCKHRAPSVVDHRTLSKSKNVPINFWRGCGLPDALIDYMPSLSNDAIQFYSCFISYSSKDQEFADRLHADLQNNGVRCWFAPHDLPIGAKTWDGIDEAIRTRDKVLLILSEGAIASDWVEDEVTTAFAEERRRDDLVLFPVRLDETVMETNEPWAGKLRDNRNIGDFSQWKDHDAYKATLDRVLRDLKTKR